MFPQTIIEIDKNGNTKSMLQALKGQIPERLPENNPQIQNNKKQTVALILSSQGIIPPSEWNHDCDIQDGNSFTVEDYLTNFQLPVPNHWITDKNKQKNKPWFQQAIYNEKTTGRIIKPEEQNIDGFTIAMIQVINGKIPEDRFKHDPNIKNIYGMSVEDIMKQQGIEVPSEWKCVGNDEDRFYDDDVNEDIDDQNEDRDNDDEDNNVDKVQVIHNVNFIRYNKIDEQVKEQDKRQDKKQEDEYIEDYDNPKRGVMESTKAMEQAEQGIIPDKKYQHDPSIQDNRGRTVAIYLAENGIIPPEEWYHKPEIINNNGWTVAMYLGYNKIIPPKEWYHDPNIKNNNNHTVAHCLKEKQLPVPNEWYTESMKNIPKQPEFVQQAIYGQIPKKPKDIDSEYDCGYGWTVAMLLAYNGKDIPEEWQHKPELQNELRYTVAILLAYNKIIPPAEWEHDPNIKNEYYYTVCYYLFINDLQIPENWQDYKYKNPYKYDEFEYKDHTYYNITKAMQNAIQGLKPHNFDYHNPNITDKEGHTVEYYLKQNNKEVPPQWKCQQSSNNVNDLI